MNFRGNNIAALLAWLGLVTSGLLPTHACLCARLPDAPSRCCSVKVAPAAPESEETPAPSCCCRPEEDSPAEPAACCVSAQPGEPSDSKNPARLDPTEKRVCCCSGLPPFETDPGAVVSVGGERQIRAAVPFVPVAYLPTCVIHPPAVSPRSEPPAAPIPLQRRLAVLCVLRL